MTAVPAEHEPEPRPSLRLLGPVPDDDPLSAYVAALAAAAPAFSPAVREELIRIIG